MANQIQPDANGIVAFRKSLFDDDGDVIDIVSIQVTKKNGTDLTPTQPAWLTYTTTVQTTTEGPKSNRTYLHIDFAIDSDHADIESGASYTITVTASDNENPDKVFNVLYTNGYFDFASVSGMTLWIAPRKQEPTDAPTDFSPLQHLITPSYSTYMPVYVANDTDGQPAFDFSSSSYGFRIDGAIFPTSEYSNPDAPNIEPVHVFEVVRTHSDRQQGYFAVEGNERTIDLTNYYFDIEWFRGGPGYSNSIANVGHGLGGDMGNYFHLVEYHREPDGTFSVWVNNSERYSGTDTDFFGETLYINRGARLAGRMMLYEFIVYQHDLTPDQIYQIKKSLKGIYPSLQFSL